MPYFLKVNSLKRNTFEELRTWASSFCCSCSVAPSTHTEQLTTALTLVPWEFDALFWPLQVPAQNGAHTYTQAGRHTHQVKPK